MDSRANTRILVLDDDPLVGMLLQQQLANLGYRAVETCVSGSSALARLDAGPPPDVILLDLNMPEMDGVEFVHHLVGRRFSGGLILISGEDSRILESAEQLARAHDLAVLGHLGKPVRTAALDAMLGGRSDTADTMAGPAKT